MKVCQKEITSLTFQKLDSLLGNPISFMIVRNAANSNSYEGNEEIRFKSENRVISNHERFHVTSLISDF